MRARVPTAVIPLATDDGARACVSAPGGGPTLLERAMDEAHRAGAERIVLVTADGAMPCVRAPFGPEIACVAQETPTGLGDALRAASPALLPGLVAVILPDDLIVGDPCLPRMLDAYSRLGTGHMVAAAGPVDPARHAVLDPLSTIGMGPVIRTVGIVEKPQAGDAPSQLGVMGRYILHPRVMQDLAAIPASRPRARHLTDAIAAGIPKVGLCGFLLEERRYDCGTHAGLAAAERALAPLPEAVPAE